MNRFNTFRFLATLTLFLIYFMSLNCYGSNDKITVTLGGDHSLRELLGDDIYEVENLTVAGTPKDEDFQTMWECGFYGKLKSLDLSDLESYIIPQNAFYHADVQGELGSEDFIPLKIENLVLPNILNYIKKYACAGLNIKELKMPYSLHYIMDYALAYSSIEKFEANPKLEIIQNHAFTHSNLKEVSLCRNIYHIGEGCFDDCPDLETMYFTVHRRSNQGLSGYASRCGIVNLYFSDEGMFILLPGDFAMNKNLKKIQITPGISEIRGNAFNGCDLNTLIIDETPTLFSGSFADFPNLRDIYCKSSVPPAMHCFCQPITESNGAFNGTTPTDANVYVPIGCAEIYRSTPGWNYFTNFIETDNFPTSVKEVNGNINNTISIRGEKGVIICDNNSDRNMELRIFRFDGTAIVSSKISARSDKNIPIAPGYYIVKAGEKSHKIIVK